MKIGILTFHCAHNYGAVLQAYALQSYLCGLGHDARIVDYRPVYLTRPYNRFRLIYWFSKKPARGIWKIFNEFRVFSARKKRRLNFENFISRRLRLRDYRQPSDLRAFDLVLLGSDQIWNSGITGGRNDDLYWGVSVPVPVASYAASARRIGTGEAEREYIRRALDHLLAVSVRERSLKEILSTLTAHPVVQVLDPTLLSDAVVYDPLCVDFAVPKRPYVLIYQVAYDKSLGRIATELAKRINGEVIEISAYLETPRIRGSKRIDTASPEEFIGYIRNASCVVTSSFHGTALSIVFRRPFVTVRLGYEIDDRAKSLLTALHLEKCSMDKNGTPYIPEIDYEEVGKRLADLRIDSRRYLDDVIRKASSLSENKTEEE